MLFANHTVIASGGAGKVYKYTSNPDLSSGDGIAMASRAGCRIANMEFMQFHPTCLYHPKAKNFLISESLRGEGAILRDRSGFAFMINYDDRKELAPRDIVARAIDNEMKKSGEDHVVLDCTHMESEFLSKRFPNILKRCLSFGIDIRIEPIPVVPAAHYTCGGVVTNEFGQSDISNLFVIGEAAFTGLHGANRLACNSLLEGVVFSQKASQKILEDSSSCEKTFTKPRAWDYGQAVTDEEKVLISHSWDEIRLLMWNYVGIVRSVGRLEKAERRIQMLKQEIHHYYWKCLPSKNLLELRNLICVAELIVKSAIMRRESRGLHFMSDFPMKDDRYYQRDSII